MTIEIEIVIKCVQRKKWLKLDWVTAKLYKIFKEELTLMPFKLFHEIEERIENIIWSQFYPENKTYVTK
jgi:hypothetical protein